MIALLHYAVLKTRRDGSFFLFLFAPAVVIAALLGTSIVELRFEYPLALSRHMSAMQNARALATMVGGTAIMFGLISAFWTLRAEIATRAIASFVVASRSAAVIASLIVFGMLTAIAAWISGIAVVILLTAAVPPKLPLLFAGGLAVALALTGVATLVVTVAPQPANLIWAYFSMFVFVPWFERGPDVKLGVLAATVFVLSTTLSTYFLRRRCAS